jgi:hypothetical protein
MMVRGKTPHSWQKHDLLRAIVGGQVGMYRKLHPQGTIALIDMHAGDGDGILKPVYTPTRPQGTLFPQVSETTASLAVRLASQHPEMIVILCESVYMRRAILRERFPMAHILQTHTLLPTVLKEHYPSVVWAMILNDPQGPRTQGVPIMQALAQQLPCDFAIVFNELAVHRHRGLLTPGPTRATQEAYATRERYAWMLDPHNWAQRLQRRHVAWTGLQIQSDNFHYRILVISHAFSRVVKAPIFEVIL